jgi:hypothetical protein
MGRRNFLAGLGLAGGVAEMNAQWIGRRGVVPALLRTVNIDFAPFYRVLSFFE